jgi:hypothetical protein
LGRIFSSLLIILFVSHQIQQNQEVDLYIYYIYVLVSDIFIAEFTNQALSMRIISEPLEKKGQSRLPWNNLNVGTYCIQHTRCITINQAHFQTCWNTIFTTGTELLTGLLLFLMLDYDYGGEIRARL